MIRRAAATRVVSLFYLTPPVTALMALALFERAGAAVTPRHGGLRRRRIFGELAAGTSTA